MPNLFEDILNSGWFYGTLHTSPARLRDTVRMLDHKREDVREWAERVTAGYRAWCEAKNEFCRLPEID